MDSIKENHEEFLKNDTSILKTQQSFKSEGHNVFTEEINKIALSSNDDKRMQSTNLIETYIYYIYIYIYIYIHKYIYIIYIYIYT